MQIFLYAQTNTVLKIFKKVSFFITTNVTKIAKNSRKIYEKLVCGQTVLPDMSALIGQKLMENAIFLGNFPTL